MLKKKRQLKACFPMDLSCLLNYMTQNRLQDKVHFFCHGSDAILMQLAELNYLLNHQLAFKYV